MDGAVTLFVYGANDSIPFLAGSVSAFTIETVMGWTRQLAQAIRRRVVKKLERLEIA
jgi:hypothetical protein